MSTPTSITQRTHYSRRHTGMRSNKRTPASTGLTQNVDSVICLNSPYPNPDPVPSTQGKNTRFRNCLYTLRQTWLRDSLSWPIMGGAMSSLHFCSNTVKHGSRDDNVHLLVSQSWISLNIYGSQTMNHDEFGG